MWTVVLPSIGRCVGAATADVASSNTSCRHKQVQVPMVPAGLACLATAPVWLAL